MERRLADLSGKIVPVTQRYRKAKMLWNNIAVNAIAIRLMEIEAHKRHTISDPVFLYYVQLDHYA